MSYLSQLNFLDKIFNLPFFSLLFFYFRWVLDLTSIVFSMRCNYAKQVFFINWKNIKQLQKCYDWWMESNPKSRNVALISVLLKINIFFCFALRTHSISNQCNSISFLFQDWSILWRFYAFSWVSTKIYAFTHRLSFHWKFLNEFQPHI